MAQYSFFGDSQEANNCLATIESFVNLSDLSLCLAAIGNSNTRDLENSTLRVRELNCD
jgi:hypothetical protein